jgi:hypothetical protein
MPFVPHALVLEARGHAPPIVKQLGNTYPYPQKLYPEYPKHHLSSPFHQYTLSTPLDNLLTITTTLDYVPTAQTNLSQLACVSPVFSGH